MEEKLAKIHEENEKEKMAKMIKYSWMETDAKSSRNDGNDNDHGKGDDGSDWTLDD